MSKALWEFVVTSEKEYAKAQENAGISPIPQTKAILWADETIRVLLIELKNIELCCDLIKPLKKKVLSAIDRAEGRQTE